MNHEHLIILLEVGKCCWVGSFCIEPIILDLWFVFTAASSLY